MKTSINKYLQKLAIILTGSALLAGCLGKDFLEVQPKGTELEENFYGDAQQVYQGLVAAYDPLGYETGVSYISRVGILNAASDDAFAGGGSSSDVPGWQAWNNYTVAEAVGPQEDLWDRDFLGVARTNILLSKLEGVTFLDAATKAKYTAEAKFLRAYYYFDLVRLFANVPLFTKPLSASEIMSVKQATPAEIYAQIEKDLKEAIPDLPKTVSKVTEGGRVTQGAAKALLGKVLIYLNNDSRLAEAAALLEDVNKVGNEYGYALQSNYGNIFRPDNKFNSESIFEIVHTSASKQDWGAWGRFEGNVGVQMFGMRTFVGPTYVAGWGFNPLTEKLVTALTGDPRYKHTVINADSLETAGAISYDPSYQKTGYFLKKYAPTVESNLLPVVFLN
jgi:starch-binding outer membrane protein, SusD/RagB family